MQPLRRSCRTLSFRFLSSNRIVSRLILSPRCGNIQEGRNRKSYAQAIIYLYSRVLMFLNDFSSFLSFSLSVNPVNPDISLFHSLSFQCATCKHTIQIKINELKMISCWSSLFCCLSVCDMSWFTIMRQLLHIITYRVRFVVGNDISTHQKIKKSKFIPTKERDNVVNCWRFICERKKQTKSIIIFHEKKKWRVLK